MEELNIKGLTPIDSMKKIIELIAENSEFMKVITNGSIGTFLMDGFEFYGATPEVTPIKVKSTKELKAYKIAELKNNVTLFIDPNMKWNDTRIIFKSDNSEKIVNVEHDNKYL